MVRIKSVLNDVMSKNNISVSELCKKAYGSPDNRSGLVTIGKTLMYERLHRDLVGKLIKDAGGDENDILLAKAISYHISSNPEIRKILRSKNEIIKEAINNTFLPLIEPIINDMFLHKDEILKEYLNNEERLLKYKKNYDRRKQKLTRLKNNELKNKKLDVDPF